MNSLKSGVLLAAAVLALSACSGGASKIEPPISSVDPIGGSQLQFAVGTANVAGTLGLNTIVTLRQSNGSSAVLLDTPTITGPAGFVVPAAASAGTDAGTNHISASPQVQPGTAALATTFSTTGGAFGYGFQPANSSTAGSVTFARYLLPFYAAAATQLRWIGGPPAFPTTRDGTFPAGFQGYPMGFTDFAATPVAGTYTLSVQIPTGFTNGGSTPTFGTLTAASNLANLTPLGTFATPTLALDGAGGGTVTYALPAGVTEAYIVILNTTGKCYPASQAAPAYYTIRVTAGTTATLPDTVGPVGPVNPTTQTICTGAASAAFNTANGTTGGDSYKIYAVGFDYPAYGASYPFSTAQRPTITGANGQADVTTSAGSATLTSP